MKKVYLIGTGTNIQGTLTNDAEAAIQSADILIGAKRMLAPYFNTEKALFCQYLPQQISDTLHGSTAACGAVLLSGDSGFFSGAKKLLPLLHDLDVSIIPGISSMSAFCARCGLSYEQMRFLSLHGNTDHIAVHVHTNPFCFFLLGGELSAAMVCRRLCEYGLPDVRVHIGVQLGYENEQILHGTAADFLTVSTDALAVLIAENPNYLPYIPSGIADTDFIRSKVPMTKSEIRCNVIAALRIPHNGICWDIGCGTGSVSVEMAFHCRSGQVYAFDNNPEAVALTLQNAHRFSCDNIIAAEGNCPEVLCDYPTPDAVFIGGSGGNLEAILWEISQRNTKANIAMTAVSLETLMEAVPGFQKYCTDCRILQIAVMRTKKLGAYTMPDTQNPIWLLTGGIQ
ncbi:MAG: precorrin-6y C5,15-methyltransferase (decarboxylating) subunit CbiE [Oscillospiraceae bacterium]|nr:precorrin-6y C5,15-methyltransferase (decarboxylating) subunit CbiE [Oscillospiraceae bacterium]